MSPSAVIGRLMLELAPTRKPGFGFLTDIPGWADFDRQLKAELLVVDWLTIYEGEMVGPLDRQPLESWLEVFLEVGYFEAEHVVTETEPGNLFEDLKVTIGQPQKVPDDLYRVASWERARYFSWFSDQVVAANWAAANEGEQVFRCRNPFMVFGTIRNRWDLLPSSEEKMPYTEWVVAPGADVRHMKLRSHPMMLFLSEGRAV